MKEHTGLSERDVDRGSRQAGGGPAKYGTVGGAERTGRAALTR